MTALEHATDGYGLASDAAMMASRSRADEARPNASPGRKWDLERFAFPPGSLPMRLRDLACSTCGFPCSSKDLSMPRSVGQKRPNCCRAPASFTVLAVPLAACPLQV